MFFLNDEGAVDLATDEANYGIGAEVSQLVNGMKRPTRFISCSLNEGECRRSSTIEMECHAIFVHLWISLLSDANGSFGCD